MFLENDNEDKVSYEGVARERLVKKNGAKRQ